VIIAIVFIAKEITSNIQLIVAVVNKKVAVTVEIAFEDKTKESGIEEI